jgi:hypothetical protein
VVRRFIMAGPEWSSTVRAVRLPAFARAEVTRAGQFSYRVPAGATSATTPPCRSVSPSRSTLPGKAAGCVLSSVDVSHFNTLWMYRHYMFRLLVYDSEYPVPAQSGEPRTRVAATETGS